MGPFQQQTTSMLALLLSLSQLLAADGAQLTVWEHGGQTGGSQTLHGPSNYLSDFNDVISSVRADSGTWELYTDADYQGSRMVAQEGFSTGAYWNDALSSARPLCAYTTDPSTAKLYVFEHSEGQGESKEHLGPVSWTGDDWNDRISSVRAVAGDWEFYSEVNYEGSRRVVSEGQFANLDQDFNDVISSFRPVCESYKGAGKCKLDRIEVIDNDLSPRYAGTEVIGSDFGGSCYSGPGGSLSILSTDTVQESSSLETGEENEVNWFVSGEVSVEASAKFLGSGGSVTMSVSAGGGSSRTLSKSKTKSYGSGASVGVGSTVNYNVPGAALLYGVVDRYEIDNSNAPVRMHLTCPDGSRKTRDSTMRMKSVKYQSASFVSMQGVFNKAACLDNRSLPDCVDNVRATFRHYVGQKQDLYNAFEKCFDGKGTVDKK